jgi:hypothetical protein
MNKFSGSSKKTTIYFVMFLAVTAFLSYGYFAGISGRTKKGGFTAGCECHGETPFSNVNVVISGPDTISPGETVNFFLSINGGPLTRGGTDIAVTRGVLNTLTGSGLRKLDGELTHEQPKAPVSGNVSFPFSYTAPLVEGTDTIFANGNSVNFDMLPYNDKWNFANNKILVIKHPIGIQIISSETPGSFGLEQNYPNPFNPTTKIRIYIPAFSYVSLIIYDISGKEAAVLLRDNLRPGGYEVEWDAGNQPGGVYFYRISAGTYLQTKKMVLVK